MMAQPRIKYKSFRISQSECDSLNLIAKIEDLRTSEILRMLIREGLEKRGFPPMGIIEFPPTSPQNKRKLTRDILDELGDDYKEGA
jgi:hypothetical protein